MELLKFVPRDGFVELEARMSVLPSMDLELFTDVMTEVGNQHRFLKQHGTQLDRAAIRRLFHCVDFRSFGKVTWEMLTMHIIDDAFLAGGTTQPDPEGEGSGGRFEVPVQVKQSVTARVRRVQYVPEWDRMIKALEHPNGEGWLEITGHGECTATAKSSIPYAAAISSFAAVPALSMVAAAHSDMRLALYQASLSNDRPGYEHITMNCLLNYKEVEENVTALQYHSLHRFLFAGTRHGSLFDFDMSKHEHAFNAKLSISNRNRSIFTDAVSCMMPLEERLVLASMQTRNNVCLFDLEKRCAVEKYSAHSLGVLSMARSDQLGLLVTAGFERVPFAWVFKIRDFPPWKLIDKSAPHKGDIINVECPSDSYHAISADDRGVIKIWDIRTFRCLQTTYGDQPTGKLAQDTAGSLCNHFHSATYHETSQTIVSCGPQNVTLITAISPQNLDCCDDFPVTNIFYVPSHKVIVTGHGRSVKVWEEATGSIVSHFADISAAELSAVCVDSTGRKLYVGTRKGTVVGHSITTGTVYRRFKTLSTEIVQMCYSVHRMQQKMLIVVSVTDLVVFEDSSIDGRSTFLGQPLQTVKMDILARFGHDTEAAHRKISALSFGGVVSSSKLSIFFVWSKRHVIGVDFGNFNIVHTFVVDYDVACVCFLGDLPAVAVLDRRSVLSIFAIRPSISSPALLARRNLSELDEATTHRKSVSLMSVARRLTVKDQSETLQILSLNSNAKSEDEAQLGQVDTSMAFDQPLRLLVVADAQGFCWQWSLDVLIEVMNLGPCSFPVTSRLTANFLRRPKRQMEPASAGRLLKLVRGFKAHDEESRGVAVIDSMGATKILTAGNDNKAKLWSRNGQLLGELCQGRFRAEEGRNATILKSFYERHEITPWRIRQCPKDAREEFNLTDIPHAILPMLRKVAHRFAAHLEADRTERQAKIALQEDAEAEANMQMSTVAETPLPDDSESPVNAMSASTSARRNDRSTLWNVVNMQASVEIPPQRFDEFKAFESMCSDASQGTKHSSSFRILADQFARERRSSGPCGDDPSEGTLANRPMKPKLKFSSRGAPGPVAGDGLSSQRRTKLEAPAFLEHECIARTDLPLNPMSVTTVQKHKNDIHERTLAEHLGLEWVVYEKALNLCDDRMRTRDAMAGVKDAVRLRMCGDATGRPVPAVPPLSTLTPKPLTPRLPETPREMERRAVSRLLGEGEAPRRSSAR
jgi:WD40 repeat protein